MLLSTQWLMWRFCTPGQPEEPAFRCPGNCLLHFAVKCYAVFSASSLSVGLSSHRSVLLNPKKNTGVWHRCSAGGWIHQVLFEGTFESRLRGGSESGAGWVCLVWSGLLTIPTYARRDLSRRRLDKHTQLWRLLFLLLADFGSTKLNNAIGNWCCCWWRRDRCFWIGTIPKGDAGNLNDKSILFCFCKKGDKA